MKNHASDTFEAFALSVFGTATGSGPGACLRSGISSPAAQAELRDEMLTG